LICRSLERRIDERKEPNRWVGLQKEIGGIADSPMIDTLLRCVVAYQTRRHSPPRHRSHGLGNELLVREKQIVAALRRGDCVNAENHLRMAQSYVTAHVEGMAQEDAVSVRIYDFPRFL